MAASSTAKTGTAEPATKASESTRTKNWLARLVQAKTMKPYFKNFWIGLYVAAAIVAAQIVLLVHARAGVYVNAAAFAALIGLALWQEKARQLAISAAILPVATMITLSLPQTTNFAQTMVFYDALLLLALIYRFLFTLDEPLEHSRLTAKGYAYALPLMAVLGQALGAIGYGLLRSHYSFDHTSLPLVTLSAIVFAAAEETFFRGLIQQRGAHVLHTGMAAALTVVFYTATCIDHVTILAPLFGLLSGIVLSAVYYKKQNLVLTLVLNASTKLVYIGLLAAFVFR